MEADTPALVETSNVFVHRGASNNATTSIGYAICQSSDTNND